MAIPAKNQFSQAAQQYLLWLALPFLALALLVDISVRVRLLDFPLERDEGGFAYIGQLIIEGIPPYKLACELKMPGIYAAYAAIMAVFGQTTAGIHLGLLAIHLATLAALFFVARKFLDLYGAAAATSAYALMVLSPAYLGLAAHATHFVMLAALLGIWVLLRVEKNGRPMECFLSGCLFGTAFLMKQPGIVFAMFGGLYLAWINIAGRNGWRRTVAQLGLYLTGCLLPFAAICLWMKIAGVFPVFWFWTVTFAREHGAIIPLGVGIANAVIGFKKVVYAAPVLWVIAGAGAACICAGRMPLKTRMFLAGFTVFSFFGVSMGLYFREHYFIMLAPSIALLAGLAVSSSGQWLSAGNHPALRHLPLLIAAAGCAQSLYGDRAVYFSLSPLEACREVYGVNPFPESIDIAQYIKEHTGKDQPVAVIGSEPQIYFYAHRHSSTRTIYTYGLMEPQPYARKMQQDMIDEIEQNPPEYLVFVSIPTSWLASPDSSRLLFDWVQGYVNHNMQVTGLIQFTGPQTAETVWGDGAATTPLRSPYFVSIFKKNNHP